jgi:tetratricopeptide (TPR) repeat protein
MPRGRALTRRRLLGPTAPRRSRLSLLELGRLLLPLALLTASPAPRPRPVPELDVVFAGCDVIRTPDGHTACKVTGASIFDRAARGVPAPGEPRTLRVRATASPGARVWASLDGNLVKPLPDRSDELMVVPLYPGVRELSVTADLGGVTRVFRLPLVADELPDQARLDEAMRLRKLGTPGSRAEAEALLAELAHSPHPAVRARAAGQRARMLAGRDPEGAIAGLRAALELDRAAGRVADEIADGVVLVTLLVDDQRDLAGADAVLDGLEPLGADFPVGRAMIPHYRSLVFSARGDLGTAAALLRLSAERAEALDLAGHLADVYQEQLGVLDNLGRRAEAERADGRLARLDALPGDPCAPAQRALNRARHRLRLGDPTGAAPLLDAALDLFSEPRAPTEARCPRAGERWRALVFLTEAALEQGKIDAAAVTLQRLEAEVRGAPARRAEGRLFEGRIELARRRPEAARAAFEAAVQLAQVALQPEIEVAAAVGRAEALEALDRVDEAERAWESAEARLDRWSALIRLGDGKLTFLGRRDGVVRRHVELLLRRAARAPGEAPRWTAQAACVARRSRARVLWLTERGYRLASAAAPRAELRAAEARFEHARDALDERAARVFAAHEGQSREVRLLDLQAQGSDIAGEFDRAVAAIAGPPPRWSCQAGEASGLSEPAPGEAILVYHPADDGWVGFALAAGAAPVVQRLRVEPEDGSDLVSGDEQAAARRRAALSDRLLRPFAAALEGKSRVRIVAAEPLGAIDFHELPLGGAPLGARASVSYGVDLPRGEPAPRTGAPRALVVAPESDLPMARVEAGNVEAALRAAGYEVVLLAGAAATLKAVRAQLADERLQIFHYAGHSVAEGRDGWDSRLALSSGGWLGLADVMTLGHVPRLVTLSSCEAAGASRVAYAEGIALAQAFVIAGAEVAVAGAHPNDDAFTSKIVSALYGDLPIFLADPSRALAAATERVRGRAEMRGVAELPALRVLVR